MFILNSDQFINKLQYLVNCGKQHSCLPQLCYTQLIDVTIVVAFVELSNLSKKRWNSNQKNNYSKPLISWTPIKSDLHISQMKFWVQLFQIFLLLRISQIFA